MNNENMAVYPPYRLVAQFADGARLLFDGLTEAQAQQSMEAAQAQHGDIAWYDGVTNLHYENGKYYKLIPPPPEVTLIDLTEYTGPLDENGFPVGLPNEISEYMKQHGEPPTVPKIIFKKNEPKEDNET